MMIPDGPGTVARINSGAKYKEGAVRGGEGRGRGERLKEVCSFGLI